MAKLVYILSMSHSGSTLLDLLTGTINNTFSTGELYKLSWKIHRNLTQLKEKGTVTELNRCSCGENLYNCEAWSKVMEELNQNGYNLNSNPLEFQLNPLKSENPHAKETLGNKIIRYLLISLLFLKAKVIIRLFLKKYYIKEVKNNWLLFDTIEKKLGYNYIVDSSKDYLRFLLLYLYRPKDTYLIILDRDTEGLVNSYIKRSKERNKNWDITSYLKKKKKLFRFIDYILQKYKDIKYLKVGYSELCKDAKGHRLKISNFLGVACKTHDFQINTKQMHLIAGNPIRFKGEIEITYDNRWKQFTEEQREKISKVKKKLNLK